MRAIRLAILLFSFTIPVVTHGHARQVDYCASDSVEIVRLLSNVPPLDGMGARMIYFAQHLIGRPYVEKTLDREVDERLVVDLNRFDCTTFVETVLALATCSASGQRTFDAYCTTLAQIRYENGKVDYPTRLHYFSSWIEENSRTDRVKEITRTLPGAIQDRRIVNFMTTHSAFYPQLRQRSQWKKEISTIERRLSTSERFYLPRSVIALTTTSHTKHPNHQKDYNRLRTEIQDGDILAIVTARKGLDTSHIGLAKWMDDGLHLINASKLHKSVVQEKKTLYAYMLTQRLQTGIRVIRAINYP